MHQRSESLAFKQENILGFLSSSIIAKSTHMDELHMQIHEKKKKKNSPFGSECPISPIHNQNKNTRSKQTNSVREILHPKIKA